MWITLIRQRCPTTYSHKLLEYIHKWSKSKLNKTDFDINLECCNKENLQIFIALILYSNTIPENTEDNLIKELLWINSLCVKSSLSFIPEPLALKLFKRETSSNSIDLTTQNIIFWLFHLTPCYNPNKENENFKVKNYYKKIFINNVPR